MVLGDAVSKLETFVCRDFEAYFKVYNLVSVHPKSIMQHDLFCGGVSLSIG